MKELRIGLVLYGGVSLAVYMNGIVTELWHLLRASRAREDGTADDLEGQARIYADLLESVEGQGGQPLRVVVDAVAGTSAGGVNGAALAKAVVDGGDVSVLSDVWIEKADISMLGAEPAVKLPWLGGAGVTAVAALAPAMRRVRSGIDALPGVTWAWARDHIFALFKAADGISTVLDGGYFTQMIAKTFAEMARTGSGQALLPDRASFDLYLTRTDVYGWPRHLPVSSEFHPKSLYEHTHAHVMRFRRGPRGGALNDDFGLTYATRSTAGFPIAFAPVTYSDVAADFEAARPGEAAPPPDEFARRHLGEHRLFSYPPECAWMIDGGVLDNKPFSHVTRAIERKPADREVYRAVVYIEPDPEDERNLPPSEAPLPLVVGKELFGLLRHEPIFADLCRLRDRNERVREINAILEADRENARRAAKAAGAEAHPPLADPPAPEDAEAWRSATNAYAARSALSGYPGYVVLKARGAARVLAGLICRALDYPSESRHAYFIRRLVMRWLEGQGALGQPRLVEGGYRLDEAQARLLAAFDVPFRLRRLRALVQATNACYAAPPEGDPVVSRARLDAFKHALADVSFAFEAAMEDTETPRAVIRDVLGEEALASAIDTAIAANDFDPGPFLDTHGAKVGGIYGALAERFETLGAAQNPAVADALRNLGPNAPQHIMEAYVTFPFMDLIACPLMEVAGIEDLFEVRVMRISPRDVPELAQGRPRLKSAELYAFKGFLERAARKHDLVWGRLDGAHRLLDLVLNAAGLQLSSPNVQRVRQLYLDRLKSAIGKPSSG